MNVFLEKSPLYEQGDLIVFLWGSGTGLERTWELTTVRDVLLQTDGMIAYQIFKTVPGMRATSWGVLEEEVLLCIRR